MRCPARTRVPVPCVCTCGPQDLHLGVERGRGSGDEEAEARSHDDGPGEHAGGGEPILWVVLEGGGVELFDADVHHHPADDAEQDAVRQGACNGRRATAGSGQWAGRGAARGTISARSERTPRRAVRTPKTRARFYGARALTNMVPCQDMVDGGRGCTRGQDRATTLFPCPAHPPPVSACLSPFCCRCRVFGGYCCCPSPPPHPTPTKKAEPSGAGGRAWGARAFGGRPRSESVDAKAIHPSAPATTSATPDIAPLQHVEHTHPKVSDGGVLSGVLS